MTQKIIKKNLKELGFEPNLLNYEKSYRAANWKQVEKEIEWFDKDHLNAAYNAVDKHLKTWRKNKVAMYYEDDFGVREQYSFMQLAEESNKIANVLKNHGIKKEERVFIFLPRVPLLYISFLGILKTGAIAGTLFQAFGEAGRYDRLSNSDARFLITTVEMSERLTNIRRKLPKLEKIFLIDTSGKFVGKGFVDLKKEMSKASTDFTCAKTKAEDYAFMLYTSGTTGKPKGVMHAHAACVQEHATAKWALDLKDSDTYWCTADPGWVTGIAYTILGSWSVGATELIFNGRFDPARWYEMLERYRVNVWYTAPTAIRMMMKSGTKIKEKFNTSALRYMASVGEPLNPEAVEWGVRAFGLPFHDNWWQTECGGICIANYPSMDIKPGSMGKPIPGVVADIVDDFGRIQKPGIEGHLALKPGWPGMMRAIWRRPVKYHSYFMKKSPVKRNRDEEGEFEGVEPKKADWYISGDRALKDKDGYFWFIGRADDVIKTAGERVGPFEVESSLMEHKAVAEAGVIGVPDPDRGEIVKAFVVLKPGFKPSEKLGIELAQFVKRHLAGHAYPREVDFRKTLPKTRSGKIMRRVLKAEELGLPIGDTSTMEEY